MKRILPFLLALALTAPLGAQVLLTTFSADAIIDYSDPALSETGQFTTTDLLSATLSFDFATGPIDITGSTSALSLTATVYDNPGIGFQIALADIDFNYYLYEGNWSDFTTGVEGTLLLTALPGQGDSFDFTQVIGLDVHFDSGSGESLDVELQRLSAVPEPAAFAILAGLAGLGFGALRRRRR